MDDLEARIARLKTLTRQQAAVLGLMCAGNTDAEMMQSLVIQASTLSYHKTKIYLKLGLATWAKAPRQREIGRFCIACEQLDEAGLAQSDDSDLDSPEQTHQALIAVLEDERDLVVRPNYEIEVRGARPTVARMGRDPEPRRISPYVLLFLTALGASLISAVIVAVVMSSMRGMDTVVERQVLVTVAPIAQQAPLVQAAPTLPPTARVEPTTRQLPPTAVPTQVPGPPEPGTLLYVGDWTAGLAGWNASPEWKTLENMLLNDGSRRLGCCVHSMRDAPTIRAPYRPPTRDYAAEAEMQTGRTDWFTISSFGIVVRDHYGAGYNYKSLFIEVGGKRVELPNFSPEQWHTYRLEASGNTLRFLVDGILIGEAIDNRYLDAGQVGFWSFGVQTSIRNLKVIAL